jgi:hypothetical protein
MAFWEAIRRQIELPLRGLREITALRAALQDVERGLVLDARRTGASWEEIGDALGLSRQAVHARHRPFVKRPDGDSPRFRP